MYKCVLLLIQILTGNGDYNFLISNLVINLHSPPGANKKYLRDCERLGLCKKAFDNACILFLQQIFIEQNPEVKRRKLYEINRLLDNLGKIPLFSKKIQELLRKISLVQCTRNVNSIVNNVINF